MDHMPGSATFGERSLETNRICQCIIQIWFHFRGKPYPVRIERELKDGCEDFQTGD